LPINCTESEITTFAQTTLPKSNPNARDPNLTENQKPFGIGAISFCIFFGYMIIITIVATVISNFKEKPANPSGKHHGPHPVPGSVLNPGAISNNIGANMMIAPGTSVMAGADSGQSVLTSQATVVGAQSVALGSATIMQQPNQSVAAGAGEKKAAPKQSLISMFDAVANLNAVMIPRDVKPTTQVFDLLRVMAMIWVILGHELAYRMTVSRNYVDAGFLDYSKQSWYFTYNMSGLYAVDIFMFMGGVVSVLSNSKFVNSYAPYNPGKFFIVFIYSAFKRYMRIMPAYVIMLWYWYKVAPTMVSGPLSQGLLEKWPCNPTNFWQSFLLGWRADVINNTMCSGWAWYLALDFRLYLTVPFVLMIGSLFGKKKDFVAFTLFVILMCGSLIYTMFLGHKDNLRYISPFDPANSMNTYYYTNVLDRGAIYYVGCIFAYMTAGKKKPHKKPHGSEHKEGEAHHNHAEGGAPGHLDQALIEENAKKEERRKRKKLAIIRKIQLINFVVGASFVVFISCILHYYFQWGRNVMQLSVFSNTIFLAFGKIVFVIGIIIALMVIAFRFKGFSEYIAHNRLLQLIANMSFTMYLIHFTFIQMRTYSQKSIPSYAGYDLFSAGLCDLTYTVFAGAIIALTVEIPTSHIWRVHCDPILTGWLKKL
jgi:peptidoglycan/LPS O-acetylase OafA/YrhL